MSTPLEEARSVLIAARALIADKTRWTRSAWAVDQHGNPVEPRSERACCWCLHGAVVRMTGDDAVTTDAIEHLRAAACDRLRIPRSGIADPHIFINDRRGHRAAVQLLDDAIERVNRRISA